MLGPQQKKRILWASGEWYPMKEANRSVPRDVHDADLVFHPGLEAGGDLRYQQDVGRLERTEPGDVPVRRLHILREKVLIRLSFFTSQVVSRKD